MRRIATAILLAALPVGGCTSMFTAYKARPFAKHNLAGSPTGELITMTGERRLAFFTQRKDQNWAYCMETLPDVAVAYSANSKPSLAIPSQGSFGSEEAFATALTKTFERSNETQFYRMAAFDTCMLYAMNLIDAPTYSARMNELTTAAINYIGRTPIKPKERTEENSIETPAGEECPSDKKDPKTKKCPKKEQ